MFAIDLSLLWSHNWRKQQVPPLRFASVGMTLHFYPWIFNSKQKCHPDRSAAQWRDLLFPLMPHNLQQLTDRTHRNTRLRELSGSVIPVQCAHAAGSLLVRISLAIILINREVAIRPGIHANLRQLLHLAGILHRNSQWQNRSRADKQR